MQRYCITLELRTGCKSTKFIEIPRSRHLHNAGVELGCWDPTWCFLNTCRQPKKHIVCILELQVSPFRFPPIDSTQRNALGLSSHPQSSRRSSNRMQTYKIIQKKGSYLTSSVSLKSTFYIASGQDQTMLRCFDKVNLSTHGASPLEVVTFSEMLTRCLTNELQK